MIHKAFILGFIAMGVAACQEMTSGQDPFPRTYYYPAENSVDQARLDVATLGMCADKTPMNFSEPETRGGRNKITFECR